MKSRDGARVLYDGEPLPHFNEVDECAGLDGLITYRVHQAMGSAASENTLHDLRWGDTIATARVDDYVWVFRFPAALRRRISSAAGQAPSSERQPPMYFRLGGGTLKGISKPGEIVWSRIFIDGRQAANGPRPRRRRRTAARRNRAPLGRDTTPQWPIMHAVTYGVTRDQMMARHKANHIQVAYAPDADSANKALAAKAACFQELGLEVSICGSQTGL